MKGFNTNIEQDTLENKSFRQVLYTAKHCQLVLMSLRPSEEIGLETHAEPMLAVGCQLSLPTPGHGTLGELEPLAVHR